MPIVLPINIETASTEKKLMLNVYQMSSQFSQHIVSLIGKHCLITVESLFTLNALLRVERRELDSSIFLASLEGPPSSSNSGGKAKSIVCCLRT